MNELALFAGAGGGILGGHLLGWRTVCAVEWEPYPASVLMQRQNDGILPPFPIWDDVRTFDGKPWRGIVDVISGGFPCQDISAAGGGAGIEGSRSGLWREMARIIGEVLPRFVFVENSPLLVGRGAAVVIGDLAALGYDAHWCCLSASDCGAPHQRDRFWLVGVADATNARVYQRWGFNEAWSKLQQLRGNERNGLQSQSKEKNPILANHNGSKRRQIDDAGNGDEWWIHAGRPEAADRAGERRQVLANSGHLDGERIFAEYADEKEREGQKQRPSGSCGDGFGRWPTEPNVGRVAHELAIGMDIIGADEK